MNVEDISKIKLNPQQQDAVEQILTFSRDPMARLLRIDGPAGTGKSTVASFAARELYSEGVQIALAAPTNKASGNLDSMSERIAPGASIRIGTIYSLLGLRLGNSGEKRELINTEQHKLEGVKLVFVDEWSMIGQELLDYIRKFSQDTGIKNASRITMYCATCVQVIARMPPRKEHSSTPPRPSMMPISNCTPVRRDAIRPTP